MLFLRLARYPASDSEWYGRFMAAPTHASCILVDETAQSRLVIEPEFGCVATSWLVRGEEVLALPAPREEFLATTRTGGIPLLYPYANRLRSDRFTVAGKRVDLKDHPHLKRDANGLAIHGLLLRWAAWERSQAGKNTLEASIQWGDHPRLMDAFPFAHTLRVQWRLSGDATTSVLEVTTIIDANAGDSIPIAFGWHPYIAVDPAREATISLPTRRRIALDRAGLPVPAGEASSPVAPSTESVGANQDDLYALEAHHAGESSNTISLASASELTSVDFKTGYDFLQIYSPAQAPFVCVEPMAAATSALTDGCASVAAGSSFHATFTIRRAIGRLC